MTRPLSPPRSPASGLTQATLALLFAAAWLALHRYGGIWHDGIFYAAQALQRLDAAAFAGDVFFAYGSQDQYTVFTALYAWAIAHLGLATAAQALLLAAHLAWIAALAALLRQAFSGTAFWLAMITVAALPSHYGAENVFSYAESFLTARVWAEAASLLVVALAIGGRPWVALLAVAGATALHPPMALAAAAFVVLAGFSGRTRLLLIGCGLTAVFGLVLAGFGPFPQLLLPMDPAWLQVAAERSPFAFVAQWSAADFGEPALLAVLLGTAAAHAKGTQRRLWLGGLAIIALGAALSALTVFWPGALLLQLQPWRMLWLAKVLGIGAGFWLWQTQQDRSPLSGPLLAVVFASFLAARGIGAASGLLAAMLLVAHQRTDLAPKLQRPFARIVPPLLWLAAATIAAEGIGAALLTGTAALGVPSRGQAFGFFGLLGETGWFVFPALGLGTARLMRHWPASRPPLALGAAAFAAFCALHWSDPAAAQRIAMRHWPSLVAAVDAVVPRGTLLQWEGDLAVPWLALRRGNYTSPMQGAGVIFSAATAREYMRRAAHVAPLVPHQGRVRRHDAGVGKVGAGDTVSVRAGMSADALRHLCADPLLDYVVLASDIGLAPAGVIAAGAYGGPFRVHDCAALRRNTGTGSGN